LKFDDGDVRRTTTVTVDFFFFKKYFFSKIWKIEKLKN
jgi:hypothetical protein